ncbi:Gfo/Idh/MocA family oxidoreductase [Paenibacillus sp. LHD-117]|uniref:Gfo/Idh/MocA family protein n=1 Tax=Paenibacillus sp. LHD-117 TaxID=3071412 RepID=UPI0027E18219|nr:Gfo/Idh/MocA family oxidoreductase [Paenibacillus sp. LHD-117]MDQ6421014.1 Gfo/Idh/MocA family oxidoreductase [Paenibacillus sp. LHD-117]
MKPIKIGWIGLGVMGSVHVEQLLKLEGVSIAAVCDRDADRVKEWGDKLRIAPSARYTDFESMIQSSDIDAVLAVTPNDSHYEIVRLCLIHGKTLMTEKPFTRTYEEAEKLLELSEAYPDSACMVGFSYRYVPSFRMSREMIKEGKLGPVRHVFIQYLQEWGGPLMNIPMNWRWDPAVTGTGVLADLGSHILDSARFLIGEPTEITGMMSSFINKRKDAASGDMVDVDIDDFASFTAVLEGGIPAVCHTSRNAFGCGNKLEVSVYGDYGALHMGCEFGETLVWVHQNENGDKVTEKIQVPERYKLKQMEDFADLVRGDVREETPRLLDGYLNQRALEAVERSFREKRAITVGEI